MFLCKGFKTRKFKEILLNLKHSYLKTRLEKNTLKTIKKLVHYFCRDMLWRVSKISTSIKNQNIKEKDTLMSIFLTGGTGFIGRKVVDLLLEKKETLHLLVRKTSNTEGLDKENIRLFVGGITDKNSITAAVQGCDKVIHSAAYAQNWAKSYSVYYKFNVEGLQNVAETSLAANVKKFVYVSTSVTFGPSFNEIVNENTPRKTDHFYTDYEKSKYEAEQEIQKFEDRGLPVITVNPARVYGPGFLREANSVTKMIRMFLKGQFPFLLGDGSAIGNYVFVDDAVQGIVSALYNKESGGKYILSGENCSLKDFFSILSEISGRKPPGTRIPPEIVLLFSRIQEVLARVLTIYPLITSGWVKTFLENWAFTSEKAEKELGYTPTSLREGLKITCDWLKENNLI